jgi:VanZ like family
VNLSAGAGWGLAAAGIVACSLLLHLPVSDVFDGLARRYGFAEYDAATRAVFLVAGLAILGWLWSGTQRHGPIVRRATAAIVGLLALGQAFIVVNGIEAIHYPQYALLTWVLVRAGIGLERSWLAATLLGAADETWQWLTLPRAVPGYLDWNDIILNALGAALGVLMIVRSARACEAEPVWPWRRLAGIVPAAGVAALAAGPLVESPFYRMTPGDGGSTCSARLVPWSRSRSCGSSCAGWPQAGASGARPRTARVSSHRRAPGHGAISRCRAPDRSARARGARCRGSPRPAAPRAGRRAR